MAKKRISELEAGDQIEHIGALWKVVGKEDPVGRMNGIRLRGLSGDVAGVEAVLHRAPEACAGFAVAT